MAGKKRKTTRAAAGASGGGAGTDKNSYNILYNYVDYQYFSQALALKDSIGSICAFGASVISAGILDMVQKNGNQLFGIPVYGQHVLAVISFIFMMASAVFMKCVIEKQQKIEQ